MINYQYIQDSIEYYEENGFLRIEAPWTVSEKVSDITKPDGALNMQFKHNDKCFVASGEQSFLYLYLKEFLPKGQYQTTTPCLRYENINMILIKNMNVVKMNFEDIFLLLLRVINIMQIGMEHIIMIKE